MSGIELEMPGKFGYKLPTRFVYEWLAVLLDSTIGLIYTIIVLLSLLSISPNLQEALLPFVVSNEFVFYFLVGNSVYTALIFGFYSPTFQAEEPQSPTLKEEIIHSLGQLSGAIHRGILIGVGAGLGALSVMVELEFAAAILLIGLLIIELESIDRTDGSPLLGISFVFLIGLMPIIFLAALIVYTVRRAKHKIRLSMGFVIETLSVSTDQFHTDPTILDLAVKSIQSSDR